MRYINLRLTYLLTYLLTYRAITFGVVTQVRVAACIMVDNSPLTPLNARQYLPSRHLETVSCLVIVLKLLS